jgi:hypothetical protein
LRSGDLGHTFGAVSVVAELDPAPLREYPPHFQRLLDALGAHP